MFKIKPIVYVVVLIILNVILLLRNFYQNVFIRDFLDNFHVTQVNKNVRIENTINNNTYNFFNFHVVILFIKIVNNILDIIDNNEFNL